ncbi:hypothetical protein V6N11_047342 [Hibiscus sabdariffa]|uniref:Secreted protein n=1 Tax=Hibiscus sabdariffa TaxID=183260 RepID=A0ABR2PBY5_9ROSI
MHFLLSWRWPRWWWVCYAWCTSRIPFGAALRFSVSWGGASLVRLASSMRDHFGSPRLELGFLLPRLGFHPKSEGYSVGDLGVRWTLPWPLFASVCPNASTECFNPSSLLCTRPALSTSTWLRPSGCEPYNTHGTFVPWPRCPFRRLAARPVRALPWPAHPLVACRVSHHWAGPLWAVVLRRKPPLFGLCELPISVSSC